MFALPWEGTSLVGTTDIDQDPQLDVDYREPFASQKEMDYILSALHILFPRLNLDHTDILSSFAGLRPIIDTGALIPYKEFRAHQIWNESGLITITGGKLTTFRLMARQTLKVALASIGRSEKVNSHIKILKDVPQISFDKIDQDRLLYLSGRYGAETGQVLNNAEEEELEAIDSLPNIWAELRWAARSEGVVHLDDLLLRRVRLGLLLPEGGQDYLPHIRSLVQQELGWDDPRWQSEERNYLQTYRKYYSFTWMRMFEASCTHLILLV